MASRRCRRAVIVYKRSLWALQGRALRRATLPRAQQREWRRSHAEHAATLREVVRVLRQAGVDYRLQYRTQPAPIRRADLVITVGGDGTFLRASHQVRAVPMLGVNSDPQGSTGFFCCATRRTFRAQFNAFLRGRLPIVPLTRLQVRRNGRLWPVPVLNDCLIAHRNPAATSRYLLRVNQRHEIQMNSGLWIGTPAGSTAVTRSAGGRLLPLGARGFQFVAREPFARGSRLPRLWRGLVSRRGHLDVMSLMADGGVYLDGPHLMAPLRWGDRLTVRVGPPVYAVGVTRRGKRIARLPRIAGMVAR